MNQSVPLWAAFIGSVAALSTMANMLVVMVGISFQIRGLDDALGKVRKR
jgi:hypothetical protein